MHHKSEAFEAAKPLRKPYTTPSLRSLETATPEENDLAKTGPEGMALLVQRLRRDGLA